MPAFFDQLHILVADLKGSWYFRVYSALWFICAIFVFTALIILGARSSEAGSEDDWSTWFENATQIDFPGFHIRIADPNQMISFKSCYHAGALLLTAPCSYGGDINHCFAVVTDGVSAINRWGTPQENSQIICTVNTTGFQNSDNILVAWEYDPPRGDYSANSYHAAEWVAPNNNVWLMLEKIVIKPMHPEQFAEVTQGQASWTIFRRRVLYHSTVSSPGYYVLTTLIGGFGVQHFEQSDTYDGWMAMGDVGGFAFFLLILHTIVMLAVGIFFTNDSGFLKHASGSSAASDAERSPLVRPQEL